MLKHLPPNPSQQYRTLGLEMSCAFCLVCPGAAGPKFAFGKCLPTHKWCGKRGYVARTFQQRTPNPNKSTNCRKLSQNLFQMFSTIQHPAANYNLQDEQGVHQQCIPQLTAGSGGC
eukprot:EG_transcript_12342